MRNIIRPVSIFLGLLSAFVVVGVTQVAVAADPAEKCETGKLKEAGKYATCRLKSEATGIKKGLPADFTKCESKFTDKWGKLEAKAGVGICPSESDASSIDARITIDTDEIATLLSGGTLPPVTADQFPATGQTTSFGAGSDGDVQAGAPLAYVDNADGTITDVNVALMWAKKDDAGGVHDVDQLYAWSTGTDDMDGTIVTSYLDVLNDVAGGATSCFAGHCDWRIANVKELQSIVDYGVDNPSIDAIFHQSATCLGCSDVTAATCSCTGATSYWSSTTGPSGSTDQAWVVRFDTGENLLDTKVFSRRVRAVRDAN